jgi:hypothetical protein
VTKLHELPLVPETWGLPADSTTETYRGRPCLVFPDAGLLALAPGVELAEGVIEVDLAVTKERAFHGLFWHARDTDNAETFFVRPHQVGNPDSIQYAPVINGVAAWQLYHGPGFWASIDFPIDDWFTIRVSIAAGRADIHVGDLVTPALAVGELKVGASTGRIGIMAGGPGLRLARFAYREGRVTLTSPPPQLVVPDPTAIHAWDVSDPFPESTLAAEVALPAELISSRSWTRIEAEPTGLVNLARVNPIVEERNTVLARAVVRAEAAERRRMQLGFSDRAIVFLNGNALFRGDDGYRSRDYRFLGSIGYWDTVYLPLERGDNELIIAVSEDFGGWGVQARFEDGTATLSQ